MLVSMLLLPLLVAGVFPDIPLAELRTRSNNLGFPGGLHSSDGFVSMLVSCEAKLFIVVQPLGNSRLANAVYSEWGTVPTTTLPETLKQYAWAVPENVLHVIPQNVLSLMGCSDGKRLVVIRNLDLLDACAGKARLTKWVFQL